jgi:hypothetical protein
VSKGSQRFLCDWQIEMRQQPTQGTTASIRQGSHYIKQHDGNPHRVMLVPIPPSKARGNPVYDPRMNEILLAIGRNLGVQLDIRDCLSFSGQYGASHETDDRPTPDQLHEDLTFDPVVGRLAEQPGLIFVFDDMLTSGAHYLAATHRLSEHFPGVQVVGNFVAHRILPNPFANLVDEFDVVE